MSLGVAHDTMSLAGAESQEGECDSLSSCLRKVDVSGCRLSVQSVLREPRGSCVPRDPGEREGSSPRKAYTGREY